ncbi:MAG TPA: lysylphosphatidylglycerol synthase domain-containing protein [Candidatus Saccharimonadales bacterium]|nr:lysylphosphatidylglycerol synthase domain-containing protein [Candidatus Saccharimonadales bacterium]
MKSIKRWLSIATLLLVAVAFTYYWRAHPELNQNLSRLSTLTFTKVILLYGLMLVVLVGIYDTILKLCRKSIPLQEHTQLTIYSSIANFFGPLQSGPGVRSIYLKQKHQVKFKDYATATVIYYLMFAGISGLALISGLRPIWLALIIVVVVALIVLVLYLSIGRYRPQLIKDDYSLSLLSRLALITFAQVLLVSLIYFIELKSINSHINFSQAIVYTGAANFSLFVSLTPGALGFRESFLLFSQHLHHINASTIIIANVIDRAAYITFLAGLFIVAMALHAKSKISAKAVA